jgi:hypothetical protein
MRTEIKQLLINRAPLLYTSLSRARGQFCYRTESRLLKGKDLATSQQPSLLYFTYYRCGSQVLKGMLQEALKLSDSGLVWVDFESYLMHREPLKGNIEERIEKFLPLFRSEGYFYGPVYHPAKELLFHEHLKPFCVLRDPRDVLVSHYYSLAYAHTVSNMKAARRRREVAAMGLDEFVLTKRYLSEVQERYRAYLGQFTSAEKGFFRYEDMVGEPEVFLEQVLAFLGIAVSAEGIERILASQQFQTAEENKTSHRRSGRWGQFREKLGPETLRRLDEELAGLLEPWSHLE